MKIKAFWLARIRLLWVAGFSLFFLLNLDQFGTASGFGPAPKYWSVGFFLATALLFLKGFRPAALLRKPIAWWAMAYLLLSIVWMGWADNRETAREGLMLVVTTVLYVGTAVVAYPNVESDGRLWNAVLWAALTLGTASIMLEYFSPAMYVFVDAGQGIPGRAAGFYLNPNIAAQTLVMILACLMSRGSPKANVIALLAALLGLFLTFSRGGLVVWAVLAVVATIRGQLPRWFLLVLVSCVVLVVLAGPMVLDALSVWISSENRNSLDRLAWLLGQGELNDSSSGERDYIASFGWNQYLQAPFLGHGLGYMWAWAANVGTHNMILRHLVEYGMFGFLIFPCFLLASISSAPQGSDRRWLWLTAGIAMLLGLFSHNKLEQAGFVFPWLAACLMPKAKPSSANRVPR